MTPTTATVPRRQQGTATRHDTGTQTGPPTLPNGSQRRMTNAKQQRTLDELWTQVQGHKLPDLYQRSRQLIARNAVSAVPDGYAADTGYDKTRGATQQVPTGDPREPGTVEMSGIDGLLLARQRPAKDPVNEATRQNLKGWLMVIDGLRYIESSWNMVGHRSTVERAEPCESCKRIKRNSPSITHGSVGGKLARKWTLCEPCRNFVKYYGRLPSEDEMNHYDRSGKWRVRENPTAPFSFRNLDGSRSTTGLTPPPPTAA